VPSLERVICGSDFRPLSRTTHAPDMPTTIPLLRDAGLRATPRGALQVRVGQLVCLPVGLLLSGLHPQGHLSIRPRVRLLELACLVESVAGVLSLSRQRLVMNELSHRLLTEVHVQAAE
jgi:hypothetical protein